MTHEPPFQEQGESSTVVFVCEHGSAKSVVAAALFNQLAAQQGISLRATSRGTDPDIENHPAAIAGLAAEGLQLSSQPRRLAPEDLANAAAVIAFSPLPAGYTSTAPIRSWVVPPVSENYEAARDALVSRIHELLAELPRHL